MWAAAAVVAAAVVEAVLAVVGLVHLPVLAQVVARWAHRVQLPLLARLLLVARAHPASVVVAQAQGPVVADLVVAPAVPLEQLLSRQSCSAAMAGSTP